MRRRHVAQKGGGKNKMKTPWWFLHKTPIAFLLWPISVLYRIGARVIYMIRSIGAYKSRRPVICVGNILAGGVGKTPIVREIARRIDAPIVMRGYKRSSQTANIGDEASMLARDGYIVHTGDRKSNVILLDKQQSKIPIVMDDGFQNPTVAKTISILVFDESIGFGNGFILPAGPLRQSRRALRRADAVIVIKSPNPRKNFSLPNIVPIFYATPETISPYDSDTRVVAFAGIGYPGKFFRALGGKVVATRSYPDHWQYTDKDLKKLCALATRRNAKLVTTEKDWMRIPEHMRDEIKYARLNLKIDELFFKWLEEEINANTKTRN